MFTIQRQHETLIAKDIQIGHSFEYEGEIMVRIQAPAEFASQLGKSKTAVIAISLNSWHLRELLPTEEVYPYEVHATAKSVSVA